MKFRRNADGLMVKILFFYYEGLYDILISYIFRRDKQEESW